MRLRSIELELPDPDGAAAFMTEVWGAAETSACDGARYLRGSGEFPYLVSLNRAEAPCVRSTTFVGEAVDVQAVASRASSLGAAVQDVRAQEPGGGEGVQVRLPEGEAFRFLADARTVAPLEGSDLPVKLTHVVLNAADAEASGHFVEDALDFRVSDRTKGMVFVRCNRSHHSIAFARAGFTSLNHIAFEMGGLDAVMRGVGRLRDHRMTPAWGPGRHGPGANVFAYFVAPFGAVVEFSTAVNVIEDDYPVGAPHDWTWPTNRIDEWGLSDKDVEALGRAERTFVHKAALQTAAERVAWMA